jgi:hypothetical protein
MSHRLKPALVLVAGMLFFPYAYGQEMGRLFFTPEQRAALDARRKARVPDKPAAVPAAPAVAPPVTRLDGYVRSSRGRATVWVNGAAVDDPQLGDRIAPDRAGRLPLTVPEGGGPVRLKPGESLDRGSGEVRDVIGGKVSVGGKRAIP